MDKKDFIEKVEEMSKDITTSIATISLRLFHSGGIDPTEYDNDYRLPKIILSQVLHYLAFQYSPVAPRDKRSAKNLEYF